MKKCGKCNEMLAMDNFTYSKAKQAYHYACRSCVKEINRVYYEKNRDKVVQQTKDYRDKNRDKCRAVASKINKARYRDLRLKALRAYGGVCVCCGEKGVEFLCIDHINNDGAEHRKQIRNVTFGIYNWLEKNDYPKDDFQILCHNCNFSKSANDGVCIHQTPEGPTTIEQSSTAKRLEARGTS